MSSRLPPHRVPTLTEVIEAREVAPQAEAAEPATTVSVSAPAAEPAWPTEAELTSRVLADVLRQVELMLEHRLREALMPALLQASDQLVLQARTELASALNEVVSRAVTQELARHRRS